MCCDIICIFSLLCRNGNVELQDTSAELILSLPPFLFSKLGPHSCQICDSPPFCSHSPHLTMSYIV